MNSKQNILNNIRLNLLSKAPMPDLAVISPVQYEDKLAKFMEMVEAVGGHVMLLDNDDDINAVIHLIYPTASVVASSLPFITADKNPDSIAEAADLADVDVGVLKGEIAVAENGCIWIPQTMKERAIMFISQALVIIVDKDKIVNNMHEAYAMIGDHSYGCFISGPSKTADIAQALVMGAQAARDVTVIIK